MNRLAGRTAGRRWLLIAVAIAMFAAVACGTQGSSAAPPAPASAVTASPAPANDGAANAGNEAATTPAATAGGLDEACVQRVLGRAASGFGDITAAERDQVFRECGAGADGGHDGPGDVAGQGFRGGGGRLGLNQECVQNILRGQDGTPAAAGQITQEQRQRIFTECADGAAPGGDGGGHDGGFFGDGVAGRLPECATEALGRTPNGFNDISRDEFQAIAEACGQDGGFGGFGGGRGFFGGGDHAEGDRRGGFRGFDLASECVTQTLGRTVASLAELTPQERIQLFQACFRQQ